MDATTIDNIGKLLDHYSDVSIRRRFIKKCTKLPEKDMLIVQSLLTGKSLYSEEEHQEYLKENNERLEQFSEVLFELNIQKDNDNKALHEALVFIEENYLDDPYKSWRSLFSNEHVDPDLLCKIISIELDSGNAPMMLGMGDDSRSLARNINTPKEGLLRLLELNDINLWKSVAKNPNCDEEVLKRFFTHKSKKIRELIPFSDAAGERLLLALLDDKEETVRSAVSKSSHLTPNVMACLVLLGVKITAKAYKSTLEHNENYALLKLIGENSKHIKLQSKFLKDFNNLNSLESLEADLKESINSARKSIL